MQGVSNRRVTPRLRALQQCGKPVTSPAVRKGVKTMRLVVTGTSQALKDIERANELLKELNDICRRLGFLSFADIQSEAVAAVSENCEEK